MRLKIKSTRVILIAAHQLSFFKPVFLQSCVGVRALAASCRQRGIHCDVVDLAEFHRLCQRDFDETIESIINKIISFPPDILGISTMNSNLPITLVLCERIKKRFPSIFVVLGGPGASFLAKEILTAFPRVDAIIRGEADTAFPDFVDSFHSIGSISGLKGLVYRSGISIIDYGWPDPIKNLDDLPIPAYELCTEPPRGSGTSIEEREYVLEVGRGCPFKCAFCVTSNYFKRQFRLKSVNRILEEIRYIRGKVGNQPLMFLHDLFPYNHLFMEQFCEEVKHQFPDLAWKCYARLDTLNESLLGKMREAGCYKLLIGLEVGTERMQRKIDKNIDLSQFDAIMNILKKLDYNVHLSFIVGFPFEEFPDIISLFSLIMRVQVLFRDKVGTLMGALGPGVKTPIFESWKHTLAYDEYGGFPGIVLPVSSVKLKQMVKDNPHIFYPYYHYHISLTQRSNSIKYILLGHAINIVMKNSLLLAYMVRGDLLIEELINNIDKIEMLSIESFQKSDYFAVMDSIRQLIYEILGRKDTAVAQKFDAVAQYELAIMEMSGQTFDMKMKVIQVNYDPLKLITALELDSGIPGDENNKKPGMLYCMLVWDEEQQRIKCATIPKAHAADLLGGDHKS